MAKVDPKTGEILDHKGRRLNEYGQELPDPTPLAPPVGYVRQPPLHELIRQMVRSERLAQEAAALGFETPSEAEDFDVDDDYDPSSPWEENFDPLEGAPDELRNPSSPSPEAGTASPAPTATEGSEPSAPRSA